MNTHPTPTRRAVAVAARSIRRERVAYCAGQRAGVTALDDLRLLARDGDRRWPKDLGVIERDIGDRAHASLPGISRI